MKNKEVMIIDDGPDAATIWADEGMEDTILSVEGVVHVFIDSKTRYHVYFDPRYDKVQLYLDIQEKILTSKRMTPPEQDNTVKI